MEVKRSYTTWESDDNQSAWGIKFLYMWLQISMFQRILLVTLKAGSLESSGKIRRVGLYQDYDKGGLHMTDIETMIKALRLAWIPRLIREGHPNWKFVPDYFFKKYEGLYFLLSCNYDAKDFGNVPSF